ncbi:MAG TPA: DUF4189 domain-containing protein [Pseudorhodoplanes sp.]|jgi:hypothetical protein|nr:DUF4189 domain-containing protein [Pseudorhodoplanes sp.]
MRLLQVLVAALAAGLCTPAAAAGALAVGACGAYGEAHDFPNAAAARAAALRQCRGRDCRIVASLRGNCAAFAIDLPNPCGASGHASGPHLGKAQNAALRSCYGRGGKDCVIRVFVCDGR